MVFTNGGNGFNLFGSGATFENGGVAPIATPVMGDLDSIQNLYDSPTGGNAFADDPVSQILAAADSNAAAATNSPILSTAETVDVNASWPPPWLVIVVLAILAYIFYFRKG